MIVAGLLLLSIGAADLVRQFVPRDRQWIGYLVSAVLVIAAGGLSGAVLAVLIALAGAAAWVWTMPDHRTARLTFWPAVVLSVACVLAVVLLGARADTGLIGQVWDVRAPFGPISFELSMLACGVLVFLLESGNVVVRAALAGENTWRPIDVDSTTDPDASAAASASPRGAFAGGRLIGPLERVLVLLLTLATAYPLLAALLAAKGIVRFPEISKDGETGARAEYFLVGSLVSWTVAFGGALLVWWAAHV